MRHEGSRLISLTCGLQQRFPLADGTVMHAFKFDSAEDAADVEETTAKIIKIFNIRSTPATSKPALSGQRRTPNSSARAAAAFQKYNTRSCATH